MRHRRRREELEIRNAEDENLARGTKLDSKLLLVANVKGELVLDVGVLPFTSGTETAVKIAAKQRVDVAARVRGELLRGVADNACIHLVLEKAPAEAIFAGEDWAGFDVSAELAMVDFPGGEAGDIPKLFLVDVVGHARLDLVLPETEAGIERRVGIEISARGIKAVVGGIVGVALCPAEVDRLEEDVGETGRYVGGVEEVGVESGVEHRDHEGPSVVSAENLLRQSHAVCSDGTANVDVGLQDGIAIRALDGVNRLYQAKGSSIETGRRRGAVFEAGKPPI